MMADYGVTDTGFTIKPLEAVLAEMQADLKANIDSDINLETVSPTGQVLGTIAGQLSKAWEMGEEVYHAGQTSADGYALDEVSSLTGTIRPDATPTTGRVLLNLDAGTTVPADARMQVTDNPLAVFRLLEAVTNSGGSTTDVEGQAYAEEGGPTLANAGTLEVILDPVAGWNTVTNPEDLDLGRLRASDAELRLLREQELALGGDTTVEAIRSELLDLTGVTSAEVVENDSDATVDSIPAHSLEAIVLGGLDAEVAEAILKEKPGGTGTYGNTTEYVLDERGVIKTINFTRPVSVDIYVEVTITGADPLTYVGDSAVKAALIAYQETKPPGTDVIASRLASVVYGLGGIAGAPEAEVTVLVGASPSPGSTSVAINSRQIADLDTTRIDVS